MTDPATALSSDPSRDSEPPREGPAQLPPEIVRALKPVRTVWRALIVLLVTNVFLGAALQFALAVKNRPHETRDLRPALPNYPDHIRADAIYADLMDSWHYRRVVIEGWRRRAYRGRYVHIDQRGRRYDPAQSNDVARTVHFFGGSTMWGTGVDDASTIPALFASRRRERGWTARNEGESGWVSRQSIDRLVNLLNQGETPDAAVFYDGANDVLFLCNGSLSINGHMRELDDETTPASAMDFRVWDTLVGPERFLWRFVTEARRVKHAAADRCANDAGADRVAHTIVNNWVIAHDLMAARGRPFVGVLQPIAYFGHPRVDHLRALPEDVGAGGRNLNDIDRAIYARVYPRIQQLIASMHEPWLVDATGAFDTNEYTYIDYCHVSANGNARIAALVDEALARLAPAY